MTDMTMYYTYAVLTSIVLLLVGCIYDKNTLPWQNCYIYRLSVAS